jgi:hypothetical protein
MTGKTILPPPASNRPGNDEIRADAGLKTTAIPAAIEEGHDARLGV